MTAHTAPRQPGSFLGATEFSHEKFPSAVRGGEAGGMEAALHEAHASWTHTRLGSLLQPRALQETRLPHDQRPGQAGLASAGHTSLLLPERRLRVPLSEPATPLRGPDKQGLPGWKPRAWGPGTARREKGYAAEARTQRAVAAPLALLPSSFSSNTGLWEWFPPIFLRSDCRRYMLGRGDAGCSVRRAERGVPGAP